MSSERVLAQATRFLATSAISAVVTLGLPMFLHELLEVEESLAVAVAFTIAFLLNFAAASRLVFRSARGVRKDFALFALSSLFFRFAEYVAFIALHEWLGLFYMTALVLILLVSTGVKFVWYRFLFGNH